MTSEQRIRQHIDQLLRQSGRAGRNPSDESASALLARIKAAQDGGEKRAADVTAGGLARE